MLVHLDAVLRSTNVHSVSFSVSLIGGVTLPAHWRGTVTLFARQDFTVNTCRATQLQHSVEQSSVCSRGSCLTARFIAATLKTSTLPINKIRENLLKHTK